MPEISDELLHDVASNVARRIASGSSATAPRSGRSVLLALSGDGAALDRELADLAQTGESLVAVSDGTNSATALAGAQARLPRLAVAADLDDRDLEAALSAAERVVAPAMSLALASRVASLQTDTPASRVILRAALRGIPVSASLNEQDFAISDLAPAGMHRALDGVLERLRDLGVRVEGHRPPTAARSVATASSVGPHPSADRFAAREPLRDFVDSLASQPCSMEPGQPCVECGVCEMRGF
ncbi:MAG: hypothetical protein IPF53_03115 [Blastocatellia bacterium]|nr:hypothetical protein [Blastocatellia bacterium]